MGRLVSLCVGSGFSGGAGERQTQIPFGNDKSFGKDFDPGVEDFGSECVGETVEGVVDLAHLAGEVVGGGGDGDDAEGGAVPEAGVVEFSDAYVEAVAKLVFEGADDLAAVLEGLGVGDGEFEGEFGDRHRVLGPPRGGT